jgi:hypothetical protein
MTDPQVCPCCGGAGEVEWPPETRPACPCALDQRDRRPAAMQRRLAYLQRMIARRHHDGEVPR